MSVPHPHHPEARTDTKWNADSEHHLVQLYYHAYPDGESERGTFFISPDAALALAGALTSAARFALHTQVRDAVAGACSTCENARLIDVPAHGDRTERVHCPDCRDVWDKGCPPTYDTLIEVEQELLR
jgi:hypothetical protein